MADERLREAERRWRETGEVADEAAYLVERVRAGDLARDRLEVAASCGHEAAVLAADRLPNPVRVRHASQQPPALVSGLRPWGQTPCLRALLTVERIYLAHCRAQAEDDLGAADGPTLEEIERDEAGLELLRAWLDDPREERAAAVLGHGGLVASAAAVCVDGPHAARFVSRRAALAAVMVAGGGDELLRLLRRDLTAWALGPGP